MQTLVYVTGNSYKFEVAKKSLAAAGIKVTQKKLDTPEIQSTDVSEVAAYSASWAAKKLGQPVVVTDTGYYIEALNGFPGPFIKYVNQWLTAEDLIRLMEGKTNRKAEIKICLAYCQPDEKPHTFLTTAKGTIAQMAGLSRSDTYPVDQIFIPEGFNCVDSQLPKDEMVEFWMRKEDYWQKLAAYLSRNE